MSDFPITEAQLVSIFAEAVFYGISVATFFESLRALVGSTSTIRASSLTRRVFMVITTLMFLVSSTDIALLLRHILNAFVYYRGAGGATEKFRQIDDPMNIARVSQLYSLYSVRCSCNLIGHHFSASNIHGRWCIGKAYLFLRCFCLIELE
jgi:hypothetical protein